MEFGLRRVRSGLEKKVKRDKGETISYCSCSDGVDL